MSRCWSCVERRLDWYLLEVAGWSKTRSGMVYEIVRWFQQPMPSYQCEACGEDAACDLIELAHTSARVG